MNLRNLDMLKKNESGLPARPVPGGFTLVEILVAMAIASLVLAAVYGIYSTQTRSYTTQNVAADVQQQVRAAVDYMAEDIMTAGLNPARAPGIGFLTAATNELRFSADLDMDGEISASEDITYLLEDNQLKQVLDNDNTTKLLLLDNVVDLRFTYSNSGYADLIAEPGFADPGPPVVLSSAYLSNIQSVAISVTVQEPAGRDGSVARTYSTRVRCRNIGLN